MGMSEPEFAFWELQMERDAAKQERDLAKQERDLAKQVAQEAMKMLTPVQLVELRSILDTGGVDDSDRGDDNGSAVPGAD